MYSGTTLTPLSGRLLGAHQKIDRLARATLRDYLKNGAAFPTIKEILHFEGVNGPDAIKRKSPAQDEPWHYFEPFNSNDTQLLQLIDGHHTSLVRALREKNRTRAAFEAAWLAHALVDGLTPAHHYPYEEKLAELRGGEGNESRTTIKTKLVMPGETRREQVTNNWKMWGPHGLLTTHGMFEWGIAGIIAPISHKKIGLTLADVDDSRKIGVKELFRQTAQDVAVLDLYDRYREQGWTPKLAREVRRQLVPVIVRVVVLAWFTAFVEAGGKAAGGR